MSRKSQSRKGPAAPDDRLALGPLPYLTTAQGLRLRALAKQALADAGVEAEAHADYLEDGLGRRFGLTNLAAECRRAPDDAWPEIVTAHLRGVLEVGHDPYLVDKLSPEEILSRTFLRLVGVRTLGGLESEWRYPRKVCDDIVEMLVLRGEKNVRYLRDEDVDRVGLDRLRAAGLEHLLRDPLGACSLQVIDGARIHFLEGDSIHTASKLLVFKDVLRRTMGRRQEYPDGVVVAAPNRYELVFSPVDQNVVATIGAISYYTLRSCIGGSGPVSPNVFWWREGRELELITRAGSDGTLSLDIGRDFKDLLWRLSDAEAG